MSVVHRISCLTCNNHDRALGEELRNALDGSMSCSEVQIVNTALDNSGLYKLMVCTNLTCLELVNNEDWLLDFDEGVAPILSSCGSNLHKLVLDKFR